MFNEANSISPANSRRTAVFTVTLAVFTALLVYKFDVLIVLAAVLAVGLLTFLFANTEMATLLVIFVLYTNLAVVVARYHNVPAPVAASVFLLLGIPLTNHLLMRRQPILTNRILWIMLVQLVVMAISAFFSDYPGPAAERIFVYVVEGILLYFLVLNTVRSQGMLRKAVWTLVMAGSLLGSLSILQQVVGSRHGFGGLAQSKESHINTGATGWGGLGASAGRSLGHMTCSIMHSHNSPNSTSW